MLENYRIYVKTPFFSRSMHFIGILTSEAIFFTFSKQRYFHFAQSIFSDEPQFVIRKKDFFALFF